MTASDLYEFIKLTLPEIMGALKDAIVTGAALTGAIIAFKGLGTWKRQINGQANYNLSKNLLVNLFKYRDAVYAVRNPFMSSQEQPFPPEEEKKNLDDKGVRYYGLFKAYEKRWNAVAEMQSEIYANLIEAEALWDEQLSNMWKKLKSNERELLINLQDYLTLRNPHYSNFDKEHLQGKQREIHDVIYDAGDNDKFKKEFEANLSKMTNYIRVKLKH
ncbi:hypothetical protein F3I27_14995 [Pantoea sp. Bo_2]|uniref:hypothetical protein n=1 Tax=unclassified Pantoea TaxID=2630326 RepID=UPI0012324B7D|nr:MULTISPECIES: hypothetical protein [unclassified Pantoea]KAA5944005.1 hypothetical protein F3I57_12535 [Pantoea sp. VH_3]KAA5951582.1 hypothetical protein F3I56_13040 [Pantoea sp. VH_25]KAA5981564.1 hypothetical protein F3I48_14150 [Pantoea sp. M_3]KAA6044582.1 hypothetical protein F3I36_14050 [Pantoea sp. FN_2b]KAA6049007.1 hypothetical protein F3I34_15000 [Pantoea sp. Bo_5]